MPEAFPAGPSSYVMRLGQVHIWRVPLASTNAALGELPGLLSGAERERAERFVFERDQARFISCRASLRLLLSRYTGIAPEEIAFRYEARGKPALDRGAGWQFNVSHSRALGAIAISRFDAVGIDLEMVDPAFPRVEVAPEIFSKDEMQDLAALPAEEQAGWFFQLWVLKEALLKAIGAGFSVDPASIRIRLDSARDPEIVSAPPDFMHATLTRFTLEPGYASALAVLGRATKLSFFSL